MDFDPTIEKEKLWKYYLSRIPPAQLNGVTQAYAEALPISPSTQPMGNNVDAAVHTPGWPNARATVESCVEAAATIGNQLAPKDRNGIPQIDTATFELAAKIVSALFHGNLLKPISPVSPPPTTPQPPPPPPPLGVLCS